MRYLVGWLSYRGQLSSNGQSIRDNAQAVSTAPSEDTYAPMSWVGDPNETIDPNLYPRTDALTRQCSALDAQNALLLLRSTAVESGSPADVTG